MSLPNLSGLVGNDINYYEMNRSKQGRALIFNHYLFSKNLKLKNRHNNERDIQSFSNILIHFGFRVSCYQDYTLEDIKNEISTVAKEDHSKENTIFIAIFTYGKNGKLAARDQWYEATKIFDAFSPENSPTLDLKPKIFFINVNQKVTVQESWTCIPHYRDFLISYSTVPENLRQEDDSNSIHINPLWKLIKSLEKGNYIKILDIISLLNQILYLKSNLIVKNTRPYITSTLTRKLELKLVNKDILSTLGTNVKKTHLGNIIENYVEEWLENRGYKQYEIRQNRLKAIIFNNYTFDNRYDSREGSKNDIERLKISLPKLGFENISVYNNLKKEGILHELKNTSKEDLDCLLVIILTFGGGRNLLAKDKRYKINELWTPFEKSHLFDKPKLFLINACNTNFVPEQYREKSGDFLFGFATCSKLCFMPNLKEGCWYIKAICDSIDEIYDNDGEIPEFCEILTKAHQKIENIKERMSENSNTPASQIPVYNSTLSKVLKFSGTFSGSGSNSSSSESGTNAMGRWLKTLNITKRRNDTLNGSKK